MIHSPCGAFNNNSPYISDGKCTKRYPRNLVSDTITVNDGYPLYRRRSVEDGGKSIVLKSNSVKSIKYNCKYVNKGSDIAIFELGNVTAPLDEINQYQLGRYISSNEAVWRILSFPIHERHPTVVHLAVHLENGQRVYFTADNVLLKSAQRLYARLRLTDLSYPGLAEAATVTGPFPKFRKFGKLFRYSVDVIIGIDLFGSCAVYQIIIAKTIKQLVENDPNAKDDERVHIRIYIIALLIPIMLLGMIRTLKYLAPFSLLADFCIVVCVISTVVYSMQVAPSISERPAWKNFGNFFEFCGVVVFSMEGVGVSPPIENNMKEPKKYPIVLAAGMSIVVCFVATVGFFGYWGYGEDCKSPVTLNFPMELFPKILKGLVALMIYVTYALNFWAPFNLVWYYIAKKYDPSYHWFWERVYRAIIITIICIVAVAFPNIGNLMGLSRDAGNALVTPLGLEVAMGGSDHLLSARLLVCPSNMLYKSGVLGVLQRTPG
ncbi:Proton-coupled amino acid transporter-like protein CG1139 [Eumeta japonica]|uniref:Proton-coupled amino acid transporter-like protein CG1139 n=1 Tax=Eumeta variegata TaxID=151549 RepID=A0A4C1ZQ77_EUMVA|nr:Proton-coupled amino acid transporter-like protein CG1139 [Eumeta japonica]